MAVNDPKVIDVISVNHADGEVFLDIADHLDWSDEADHLRLLQDKIHAYASFIESGEIESAYPAGKGCRPVIHVACMNPPSLGAVRFFDQVRSPRR